MDYNAEIEAAMAKIVEHKAFIAEAYAESAKAGIMIPANINLLNATLQSYVDEYNALSTSIGYDY